MRQLRWGDKCTNKGAADRGKKGGRRKDREVAVGARLYTGHDR